VVNLSDPTRTREEARDCEPLFEFEDGFACWEVWFFSARFQRWICMALRRDSEQETRGVVYLLPHESPHILRDRLVASLPG
jgi:hypothetical protein